jgi:hypothetical protein
MVVSFVGTANYHKAKGKANLGKASLMTFAATTIMIIEIFMAVISIWGK